MPEVETGHFSWVKGSDCEEEASVDREGECLYRMGSLPLRLYVGREGELCGGARSTVFCCCANTQEKNLKEKIFICLYGLSPGQEITAEGCVR